MKSCNCCPINITTDQGDIIDNYGCLANYFQAIQWYQDTGKVWACHVNPKRPCRGLIIRAKRNDITVTVDPNKPLITEEMTIAEIYS